MGNRSDQPFVSIIVPCRNEGNFIEACLDSVCVSDYPQDQLEVLVVDGMSEDGTRTVIEEYAQRYSFIRILENPNKITQSYIKLVGLKIYNSIV